MIALAAALVVGCGDDGASESAGPPKVHYAEGLEVKLNEACGDGDAVSVGVRGQDAYGATWTDRYVIVCGNGDIRVVDDK